MSWSIHLGTVAGTTLRLHVTFFLLLVWIGTVRYAEGGAAGALDGVIFVIAAFLCVVLHEFGHIFAARRYGIRTPEITILPIGGLAHLERMPSSPRQELVVAIAGPLVNVAIAAALFTILGARFDLAEMAELERAQTSLTGRLAAVNVVLVVFNLIPAFPLDGGRIFRALLAMRMPRVRATRVAARVGQGTALALALLGLFGNPFLLLISVFIFFAAEAEARQESQSSIAEGFTARDAMVARFETLGPASTAGDAARLLMLTTQQEFPVVDAEGRMSGVVTRQALIDALGKSGEGTPVRSFLASDVPTAAPDTPLSEVMERLGGHAARMVGVLDASGRLTGYVNAENLSEFFMLREAQGGRGGEAPGAGGLAAWSPAPRGAQPRKAQLPSDS